MRVSKLIAFATSIVTSSVLASPLEIDKASLDLEPRQDASHYKAYRCDEGTGGYAFAPGYYPEGLNNESMWSHGMTMNRIKMAQRDGIKKFCNLAPGELWRVECTLDPDKKANGKGVGLFIKNVQDFNTTYPCEDYGKAADWLMKECGFTKKKYSSPAWLNDHDRHLRQMIVIFAMDDCL